MASAGDSLAAPSDALIEPAMADPSAAMAPATNANPSTRHVRSGMRNVSAYKISDEILEDKAEGEACNHSSPP